MDLETLAVELESQSANGNAPGDTYPIRRIKDAYLPDKQDWLIQDIFQAKASGYLYGPASSAKTGLVVETLMRAAYGLDWFDKKMKSGCVAIVAGEGDADIMKLIRGFIQHYEHKGLTLPIDNDNLLLIPEGVGIDDKDSVIKLAYTIHTWLHGRPLRLIVFDTLATCLDEADETKNADMMRVNRLMRVLQRAFGCSTLIVHHAGKDESKGMRGASDLRNSADLVMKMEEDSDGLYKVTVEKLKGKQKPKQPLYFEQLIVELNVTNNFGDAETGYVLLPVSASATAYVQAARSLEDQVLDLMQQAGEVNAGGFYTLCRGIGIKRSRADSIRDSLLRKNRLVERSPDKQKGEHSAAKYYCYVDVDLLVDMPTGDDPFASTGGNIVFRSE